MIDGHWEKRYNKERPGRHAGTHVCAVQKTNISAGPKKWGRTLDGTSSDDNENPCYPSIVIDNDVDIIVHEHK